MKFSAHGLLKSDRKASFLILPGTTYFRVSEEQDSNHHARRRPCARLLQTAAPGAERPARFAVTPESPAVEWRRSPSWLRRSRRAPFSALGSRGRTDFPSAPPGSGQRDRIAASWTM